MEKSEIFEMAIRELTEAAIEKRKDTRDIVKMLPEEQQKILTDYFEKTNLIADHECQHLYVQGAKDCVELLKNLGAL